MRLIRSNSRYFLWFTMTSLLLVGFQNCSPVAVTDAAGGSNLVQGANSALDTGTPGAGSVSGGSPGGSGGTNSGGVSGGTTTGPTSSGTTSGTTLGTTGTTVTSKPPSGSTSASIGVCVLTCKHHGDDEDDMDLDMDRDKLSGRASKMASAGIHGQHEGLEDDEDGSKCGDEDETELGHKEQVVQHRDSDHDQPKTACMTQTACQTLDQALSQGHFKLINAGTERASVRNHAAFRERRDDDDCGPTMTDDDVKKSIDDNQSH